MATTRERVYRLAEQAAGELKAPLSDDTTLNDLGLNLSGILDLLVALEREFHKTVQNSDVLNVPPMRAGRVTLGQLIGVFRKGNSKA